MCFQLKGGRKGTNHPRIHVRFSRVPGQGSVVWAGGHPHSYVSYISTLQGGILAKEHDGDYRLRVITVRTPKVESGRTVAKARNFVVEGRDSSRRGQEAKELPKWGKGYGDREVWGQPLEKPPCHLRCNRICSSHEKEPDVSRKLRSSSRTPQGTQGMSEGWDTQCLNLVLPLTTSQSQAGSCGQHTGARGGEGAWGVGGGSWIFRPPQPLAEHSNPPADAIQSK